MREIRTSGLMSGEGKRSVAAWPKPPRPSSTLLDRNEASLLHVFDVNRVRTQEAASVAYSRRRQNYHRLSASDLFIEEENMAGGDRHGNREAKKPKKLKPNEIDPVRPCFDLHFS
jgi:hypothetical protein